MKSRITKIIIILMILINTTQFRVYASEDANAFEITKVVDNGEDDYKLVFLILGNGYYGKLLVMERFLTNAYLYK